MLLQRKKEKKISAKAGRKRNWFTMVSRTSAMQVPSMYLYSYLNMEEGAAIIRPMTQLSPKSQWINMCI